MKEIFVTGLCTLHWGRLEYGNIGNYYIVEPLVRQLHKHFPEAVIKTTFQMSKEFVEREHVEVLPMDLYYAWRGEEDVNQAYKDLKVALGEVEDTTTPYLEAIKNADLILNVSGDMWGDNAEHVGHKRFLVDCLKMKSAQVLGKKTILYAVTPGPFSKVDDPDLAKDVFQHFTKVVIREKISESNLKKWGISTENVVWAPCPSYLFEPNYQYESKWTDWIKSTKENNKKVVGLTFGGFNMPVGPYDMWPREEWQYDNFIEVARYILEEQKANLLIFSHTNGFELPPHFKLKSGRDFDILNDFYGVLLKKYPQFKEQVCLVDEPLLPADIKSLISKMDILITGRVHASVAAVSQCVPTIFIEYDGRVIYSDKMSGFSSIVNMEKYVCKPENAAAIKEKVGICLNNLIIEREALKEAVEKVKTQAVNIFEEIKNVCSR
ncbi:MAG: polysaccharide pyruvyl transferase family protein [Lachnospiraceae bacterium]|nr:polysaccharide pyruvyl transferase family protein [Lachnospiraceae bacterium]